MNPLKNKFSTVALACAAACATLAFSRLTLAEDAGTPTAAPSTQPAAVAAQHRSFDDLYAEYKTVRSSVHQLLPDTVMVDPQKRAAVAPKAIELLNHQLALLNQIQQTKEVPPSQFDARKQELRAELLLLNDTPTVAEVNLMLASKDPARQAEGKGLQIFAAWIATLDDATTMNKMVDQVEKLDRAFPASDQLSLLTINLSDSTEIHQVGDRLDALTMDVMKTSYSKHARTQILAERESAKTQQGSLNKPMEIAGKTVDGKDFNTASWKGKVVLVDFWATWCEPCKAALPRVKQVYSEYHDKGLEIVGVSNDYAAKDVTGFTPANNMPWPQLIDTTAAAKHQWNPITLNHAIIGIPTMYLIDKKGILRSVTAFDEMDKLVPKLLAE